MNLRIFKKFDEKADPMEEQAKSLNQLLIYDLQDELI